MTKNPSTSKKREVVQVLPAGEDHQVVTLVGGEALFRRKVCPTCPWRVDACGEFPAEAFRHSANTAYDMSEHVFSCHESGIKKPAICAGFTLRGAAHNLTMRLKHMRGEVPEVEEGGIELHENYRAMAIANGVPASDEVLKHCRD